MQPIVLAGGATRRDRRAKRPDAAANARPRKVAVTHGGKSALARAAFDLRTRFGRAYRAHCATLTAHVGGDPTAPQAALIDQAARLRLLGRLAWEELVQGGAFRNGAPRLAFDAYRKAAADEREVLRLLGVERRQRPIQTIEEYLAGGSQDA